MNFQLDYQLFIKNARLPQRLADELCELFARALSIAHDKTSGKSDEISISTQQYRVQVLVAGFRDLRKGGFAIMSPWNLGEKHIRYLINFWVNEKKHSQDAVKNRLTCWRALAAWMKKPQLVQMMNDYMGLSSERHRPDRAAEHKTIVPADVDVGAVFRRLCQRDRWVAMQIELQATFGLCAKESMLLRPLRCLRARGHLHVIDGTKDRQPRVVPIDAEWQYDVLIRAARLANPRTGFMIPDPWSLKEWYHHFYHILKTEGIGPGATVATVQGLRLAYLRMMSEQVTGLPALMMRQDYQPDPQLLHAAIEGLVEVAREGGGTKARASVSTFAYLGERSRPLSAEDAIAAIAAASGNKSEAAKSLKISRQALYRLLAKGNDRQAASQ
ncbi:integrase domain-containing protein [Paraburkholderia caribensis]|uniref:integrase domain-containing protein n=1 Tax=Paraburkholderia caribensis TaxID=75105 RepID=UPI00071F5572|nr:integrase domain-containing protein [Paraburkholderia caribensis]ALP62216.1 Fis family transcriptional regulator [Paraburkholderia caribensis]AUT52556.1 Fis family transcriptional regulator [Paraburkholderia caribensis]